MRSHKKVPIFQTLLFNWKKKYLCSFCTLFLLLKQSYIRGNNIFREISSPWGIKLSIWIMKFLLSRLQSPTVKNLSCEILIAWDLIKRCTWWKQCKSVLTKMAWRKTRYLYVGIPYICHDPSRFHSKITSDWYIQSQNLLNFCYSFDQHHLPGMIRPSNSTINGCHFLSMLYLYMYSLTAQQKVKICIS